MPWICCQVQLTDDVGACPKCNASKQKWTMRLGRKTNRLVVGREKPKTVAKLALFRGTGVRTLAAWSAIVEDANGAQLVATPREAALDGRVAVKLLGADKARTVRLYLGEDPERATSGLVLHLDTPGSDVAPKVVSSRLRSLGLWAKSPLEGPAGTQEGLELDLALARLRAGEGDPPVEVADGARDLRESYEDYVPTRALLPRVKFDDAVEVVTVASLLVFRGQATRRGPWMVAVEDQTGAELSRSRSVLGAVEVRAPRWAAGHVVRARVWAAEEDEEDTAPAEGFLLELTTPSRDAAPCLVTARLRSLGLWGKAPLAEKLELKESQQKLEVDLALFRHLKLNPQGRPGPLAAPTASRHAKDYLNYSVRREKLPRVAFADAVEVVVVGRVALFRGAAARRGLGACHVAIEDAGGAELARSQVDVDATLELKVPAWAAPHAARARVATVTDHEEAAAQGLVIGLAPHAKDDAPDVATHRLRNLGLWGKAPLAADADLTASQTKLEVDLALARQQRTIAGENGLAAVAALDATSAGAFARAYLTGYLPARAKLPTVKFEAKVDVATVAKLALFRAAGARALGACVVAVDDASGAELARSYVDLGSTLDVKVPAWAAPHAARVRLWTAGGGWGLVVALAPHAQDDALDVGTARLRSLGAWTRAPLAAGATADAQTALEVDLALARHLRSQAQAVQPFAQGGATTLARLYHEHAGRGRTTLTRPQL